MFDVFNYIGPLTNEVAEARQCSPLRLRRNLMVLTVEAGAIAYARRANYPHIRRCLRDIAEGREENRRLYNSDNPWSNSEHDSAPQPTADPERRRKLLPLIETIAGVVGYVPEDILLDDLPNRAVEAAAYAYGLNEDHPRLRHYTRALLTFLKQQPLDPTEPYCLQLDDIAPHHTRALEQRFRFEVIE